MTDLDPASLREHISNHEEEILDWLKKYVAFASENRPPAGNEGEAQEYIAEECRNLGLEVETFSPEEVAGIQTHPAWLEGRDYSNNRINVNAVWKGKGGGRSLLFSGHTDVAPFEPDNWSICRPFDPVSRDGKLYGRGTGDMKGGIGASFWAVKILKDMGFEPSGDIIFETVVDEEFAGGNGTLASRLKGYNADLALYTEPSGMEICPAALGAFLGTLTVIGNPGMPFTGYTIPNPIAGAARVVHHFMEWEKSWQNENSHPLFTGEGKEVKTLLWHIDSTSPGTFTQMGTPMIVKISWIVWCYPGREEQAFFDEFRAFWTKVFREDPLLEPFSFQLEKEFHYVKPWETDINAPGVATLLDAFKGVTGNDPSIGGAPFSCDIAHYGETGNMPVIILGPRCDNLHGSDEWVLLQDIFDLTAIFASTIVKFCG